MEHIDAHVHIFQTDPAYRDMLVRLSMRVLNICVIDKEDRGFEDEGRNIALRETCSESPTDAPRGAPRLTRRIGNSRTLPRRS